MSEFIFVFYYSANYDVEATREIPCRRSSVTNRVNFGFMLNLDNRDNNSSDTGINGNPGINNDTGADDTFDRILESATNHTMPLWRTTTSTRTIR